MWAAEADIDEEVDSILAIGNYGQGHFEDGAPPPVLPTCWTLITIYSTNPTSSVRRGLNHRHPTAYGPTGGLFPNPGRGQSCEYITQFPFANPC